MRTRRHAMRPQRGATLVIALILLVILTLFGISAISTGVVNLRITRNTQMAAEQQAAAQRVIDTQISALSTFTAPAAIAATAIDATGGGTTYLVSLDLPDCVYIKAAPGYSYALAPQAPKDTTWRLVARATDSGSGAQVVVTQGVKVRLGTAATCP